jgi:hypothetical protein
MSTVKKPLEDCKLELGEWYYNPMMELHGHEHKPVYTKVSKITKLSYWSIEFDEIILLDGTHLRIQPPLSQSNERYVEKMEHVKFHQIKLKLTSLKFGL